MASPQQEEGVVDVPSPVSPVVGEDAPPELFTHGPTEFLLQELDRAGVEVTSETRVTAAILARHHPVELVSEIVSWISQARGGVPPQVRLRSPCTADGCTHVVGSDHFLCIPCWNSVPLALRRKAVRAYKEGSPGYIPAAMEVIQWASEHLGERAS